MSERDLYYLVHRRDPFGPVEIDGLGLDDLERVHAFAAELRALASEAESIIEELSNVPRFARERERIGTLVASWQAFFDAHARIAPHAVVAAVKERTARMSGVFVYSIRKLE